MDRAFQRIRSLMLRDTFYSVPPNYLNNIKLQKNFIISLKICNFALELRLVNRWQKNC